MRKAYIKYLFFIPALVALGGCSKPYSETLPAVQINSVSAYGMVDSVLVTATVTSQGAGPIEYEGFSFSNTPTFDLLSRQVLLYSTATTFSVVLPAYQDSTFYFEAFVANQYGYGVSKSYAFTVPTAKPDSAPCSIPQNTVEFQGNYTPSDILWGGSPPYGSFYVEADFGFSNALDIYFNQVPTNGEYNVLNNIDFTNSTSKYAVTLILNLNSGFNSYGINEGGYVYISQNSNGSTTVSFCSLSVNINSVNYPLSAKITFN